MCKKIFGCGSTGFGVPNRRRRVFLLASLYSDPRDVLLTQVQYRLPNMKGSQI